MTDEWIMKIWYIHTMKYYSTTKRNETGSLVEMWMDPESIHPYRMKLSQKEKTNVIHEHIHVESREMVQMNLSPGQRWRHRHREWICGCEAGGRGGWAKPGGWD